MTHGFDGSVSQQAWRGRFAAFPDYVQAAIHAHAPLPEPPSDPSNITAVIWAVIAAEAALAGQGGEVAARQPLP